MALVQRGNHTYFYQSVRDGHKVHSVYIARDGLAEAMAYLDERERDRRRRASRADEKRWSRERRSWNNLEENTACYKKLVDSVFTTSMMIMGYHLHKRTWRPRRMSPEQRKAAIQRYHDFWDRAAKGDLSTLAELKRHFDAVPELYISIFRGDLAARVVEAILDRIAGKDLRQREAIRKKAEQYQRSLADRLAPPIETILAERCAVLYLAAYEADLFMYENMSELSTKRAEFHERRRDRANKRFLSALKALALMQEKVGLADPGRGFAARFKIPNLKQDSRLGRATSFLN
jgi:hypothetical protein